MKLNFYYTKIIATSCIRSSIENIQFSILFRDVDESEIDESELNFLVFPWETLLSPLTSSSCVRKTHSAEFMELLSILQKKNFYFLSDFTNEAKFTLDNVSSIFIEELKKNKIDISRLIIGLNDSLKVGFNKIRYRTLTINTIFFPKFFLSTYTHLQQYVDRKTLNPKTETDKKFLCLNRRMNYDKYKIIQELFDRDLLDETRYTCVSNHVPKKKWDQRLLLKYNIDPDSFESIQLEGDVFYGNIFSYDDTYLYTINPEWYYKSKVNIITETTYYPEAVHLTEKIWKAIYLGVPFVISAPNKHYLKTLQTMGFKTFESVIDEKYDELNWGTNKITEIVNAAENLCKVYSSPEVLEICSYNQKLYFNDSFRKHYFKTVFLDNLQNIDKQLSISHHYNKLI